MIGKTIRDRRKQLGISMKSLADKLNISIPAVSKIESGFTDITLSRFEQIADVLQISVPELLLSAEKTRLATDRLTNNLIEEKLRECNMRILALNRELIKVYEQLREIERQTT
jgi:transcriptional regulator with XRE-family HTH domain